MQFELFGQEFGVFYIISQVFALVATFFGLWAFQRKKKIQIINYTVVAAACSVLHYLFLGAWSGALTKTVGVVRNTFAAYETHKHKTSKVVPFVFVLFYVIAGISTYQSPASLLPVAAAGIYTLAIYYCTAKELRYVAIVTSGLWLIYGICVYSIVGVLAETIFIINDLVAIYRYRRKKKR